MKLSKIHHIAIIGTDYNKTTDFYINKLKFEKISEYNRPEKNDILLNNELDNLKNQGRILAPNTGF